MLMVGLDAAGKTTMLYKMELGPIVTTIPTIGFNVRHLTHRGRQRITSFTMWDLGGRDKIRPLWRHYYQNMDALIFVVDSNDRERIEDAKAALDMVITEEELRGKPLLVFANKQDLPGAMKPEKLVHELGLHGKEFRCRRWFIQGSCATTGDGIFEGLDWLQSQVASPGVAMSVESSAGIAATHPGMNVAVAAASPEGQRGKGSEAAGDFIAGSISDTESTVDTEATREDGHSSPRIHDPAVEIVC